MCSDLIKTVRGICAHNSKKEGLKLTDLKNVKNKFSFLDLTFFRSVLAPLFRILI